MTEAEKLFAQAAANPQAALGGAKMAALIQISQFVAHCKPVLKHSPENAIDELLEEIDRAHGLVMSVTADGFAGFWVLAYMKKEA